MSELELIVKLRQGDPEAFKLLYEKYFELTYFYILSKVNDKLDAEDLTEELFFHLWENRKVLVIRKSLKNYILSSARNRTINYFNSSKTKALKMQEPIDEDMEIFSEAEIRDIADNYLLAQELREHISKAVNKLPDKCRKIFKLSRLYNYKYAQIAEKLGVSINTVEKQISIALQKLRVELKDFFN